MPFNNQNKNNSLHSGSDSGAIIKGQQKNYVPPLTDSIGSNQYIYDSGLQSIFDDYQKNVAILSQKEKQNLQDAYTIREISKKYLGEYASNTGIGDVSGNLIDIYSKYQENVGSIQSEYDNLELNLEQSYQQAKQGYNEKAKEKQDLQAIQDIKFNISQGNTNGLTNLKYLESQKNTMDKAIYQELYLEQYNQGLEEIGERLSDGNLGKDENGNPLSFEKFLEKAKTDYNLTDKDYNNILEQSNFEKETAVNMYSVRLPYTPSGEENPYFNQNFDPTYFGSDENLDKQSDVYYNDKTGEAMAQIILNVEQEHEKTQNARLPSNSDLNAYYDQEFGQGNLKSDDIMAYFGNYYVFKSDTGWHRLVNLRSNKDIERFASENMSKWTAESQGKDSVDKSFKTNGNTSDTLEFDGMTFVEDNKDQRRFNPNSATTDKQKELVKLFQKVHYQNVDDTTDGGKIKRNSVVYFDGMFWEHNYQGIITPMKRK